MNQILAFFVIVIVSCSMSFLLGATRVSSQGGGLVDAGFVGSSAAAIVDGSGQIWTSQLFGSSGMASEFLGVTPLPKAGNVVDLRVSVGTSGGMTSLDLTEIHVLYADGDIYWTYPAVSGGWQYLGNVLNAPVQTTETTWGRIKAKRR